MLKLLHPNSRFYLKPKTRNAKPFSLSPRAQERFTHVSIRVPIKQFRPILQAPRLSGLLRSRLSLPADLFHRVIELDTVTVRVKNMGRIVDARVKLGRYRVRDSHVVRLPNRYGVPQLAVVGELQSKRGACRMSAEAENFPEPAREARHGLMLRVAAPDQ